MVMVGMIVGGGRRGGRMVMVGMSVAGVAAGRGRCRCSVVAAGGGGRRRGLVATGRRGGWSGRRRVATGSGGSGGWRRGVRVIVRGRDEGEGKSDGHEQFRHDRYRLYPTHTLEDLDGKKLLRCCSDGPRLFFP